MTGNRIFVGVPRERFTYNAFSDNRDQIFARMQEKGLFNGYYVADGHRVDRNRTGIVAAFMNHPDKPDWLLQLDSDMEHPVLGPEMLLETALERDIKIIAGLYFHRGKDHMPFFFKIADVMPDEWGRPTQQWTPMRDDVFDFLEANQVPMRDGGFVVQNAVMDPVIECDAVATGMLLVHRSIFEAMTPPWFSYDDPTQSEDLIFCKRVKEELGVSIYGHMGVVSGHLVHAPIGQAQFRQNHMARGLTIASISPEDALKYLQHFLPHITVEDYNNYTTEKAIRMWEERPRGTPKAVHQFYENNRVGENYLIELMHWNTSQLFGQFREALLPFREMRILEIGSGIGTVVSQMLFQRNHVVGIEINDFLRKFAEWRVRNDIENDEGVTRFGDFDFVKSIDEVEGEFDMIIAIDVLEHIHPDELPELLKKLGKHLRLRGRMFHHNNWYQQDIFPFHYNHQENFEEWMKAAGFFVLDPIWSVKVEA